MMGGLAYGVNRGGTGSDRPPREVSTTEDAGRPGGRYEAPPVPATGPYAASTPVFILVASETMSVIDEYLKTVKPSQRVELQRIRDIVKELAPDAEETIAYGMPTYKLNNKVVIYFAAYKNHMSIFPPTIKFTEAEPLPESVVRDFVQNRLKGIKAKA
jgi:Domain of unknown function (DU1801)